jgi:uncharacterized protein
MNSLRGVLFFVALILAGLPCKLAAEPAGFFEVPRLTSPVVDEAGIMSIDGRQRVEKLVRAVQESGGSQISVLTVKSLGGLSIEEASIKVVDQWKLGRQDKDDGVLLMVAPNDRRLRIEVGRGKEGDLPDAIARRIINQVIGPAFRGGQFDNGILLGVAAIIQKTDPEFDLERAGAPRPRTRSGGSGGAANLILILIFILFMVFMLVLRVIQFLGLMPRSSFTRGYGNSGWGGGFGGGSGWGGGGGGGGWSGGGGGFSGGGSSGSW